MAGADRRHRGQQAETHPHRQLLPREENAARAYDRVSIAELGHTQARTNFPVAEYQEEWAQLEALGVDTAVAREKQRAKRLEA